ncbi:hypothetical protein DFH09DRAFT_1281553 [Mycena vulgaris]|nr:hypothetical protein DFH09DRAFT_1281553 [Mycena vulgaris]
MSPQTPSSPVALPPGCSADNFPGPNVTQPAGDGFRGCTVGVAPVLLSCCARVGGTPAYVHNTCGCPFGATFLAAAEEDFTDCTLESIATSTCYIGTSTSTPPSSEGTLNARRWNAATLVLGVALLFLVVGDLCTVSCSNPSRIA